MGQQLVLRTVLRRSKNNFRNQNSCFLLKSHLVVVFRGINPHLSNAISQQPLSYWQKCYSLNLSETKTLGGCIHENKFENSYLMKQMQITRVFRGDTLKAA